MKVQEDFNRFCILMYKGFLLRKRHYIVTMIEIIIPIIIGSIPSIIMSEVGFSFGSERHHHNATFYSLTDPFSSFRPSSYLMYTPKTTEDFMQKVYSFWKAKTRSSDVPLKGFNSESELEDAAMALMSNYTVIGTVFMNALSDSHLQYKIRCGSSSYDSFHTDAKVQYQLGPRYSNAYSNTGFMSWQAAVEQTFIYEKTGQSNFQVSMQRFPYPAYDSQPPLDAFIDVIISCFTYSLVVFCYVLVKRIVSEKADRSKELLKMMGMNNFNYWSSTFLNYFLVALVIVFILTIVYVAPLKGGVKTLENTNFFLLFIIFMLYVTSTILSCLAVTTVFNKANVAVAAVMILLIVPYSVLSSFYLMGDKFKSDFFELSSSKKLSMCLLPNVAISIAFKLMASLILSGEGVHWTTLYSSVAAPDLNLGMVMGMMVLSCIFFCIITWYLDNVWPWQYGVPKPLYFPFTKSYWCGSTNRKILERQESVHKDSDYFEPEPVGSTPGIVMQNLTKVFKSGMQSQIAVDNMSLNIYSGQITALLGRNGAGKTTTINMLTGLFTPSGGSAAISGWDIETNMDDARKSLGICPQDNVLYPTLTVEEHLILIAGLKGGPWRSLKSEANHILKLLSLEDKRNTLTQGLSGGMKRKLGLGLAIVGGSKVLFLDEPTSGMDPENRRILWDILLRLRHERTIVLTTHYMEEADILGDRIAIMVDGKIRCCGSPVFLKRKFGTGYQLNVTYNNKCDIAGLTLLLQKFIPETTLQDTVGNELKFSFSGNVNGASFVSMFRTLESQPELGLTSFGMTVTTMDDVFLKVNTMGDEAFLNPELTDFNGVTLTDFDSNFLIQSSKLETGFKLWLNCIRAIILKRFAYAKRYWSVFLYLFVFPILWLSIFLAIINALFNSNPMPPPMALDIGSVYGSTEAVYKNDTTLDKFSSSYYFPLLHDNHVTVNFDADPQQWILKAATDLSRYLKHILIGGSGEMLPNSFLNFVAWYNGEPFHALPMSLNLAHTAILRNLTQDRSSKISLINAPLPQVGLADLLNMKYLYNSLGIIGAVFAPLVLGYMSASYISVPIQECSSRAKLLQMMSRMSALTYWVGMLVWDMLVHSIASLVLLIPFAIFDPKTFYARSDAIGTVLLLLIAFGWSIIPFCYIFSRFINKPATGYSVMLSMNFLLGVIPSVVLNSLAMLFDENNTKVSVAMFFLRVLPIFAASSGISKVIVLAYKNTECERIPWRTLNFYCSSRQIPDAVLQCCKSKCGTKCFTPTHPITWEVSGCGRDLLFLLLDGLLYFAILMFLETKMVNKFWDTFVESMPWKRKHTAGFVIQPEIAMDDDVYHEAQKVEFSNPVAPSDNAMVAVRLTKKYANLCAVDHLSFAVNKQECFGLLGVNGAGKTSTFKMLCGDIFPNEGNAFIEGRSLETSLRQFQSFIGYCPQYDALIDRLTGRETLRLFAAIRGIPWPSIDQTVSKLIEAADLQEHANKQTQLYSGGNKRKLSLAVALIGSPPLILLDEPTSGVDPVSRRKIWHILRQARQMTRAAVVLCTHSMEECEALCSRLSIMVRGKFRCLGSIQHLKTKFGQGFMVVIKFKNDGSVNDTRIGHVKSDFEARFPSARIKDINQGVLSYHVSDPSIPWSFLFESMEQMKQNFDLEDYFISGTSLEQIFLAFAKNQ